MRHRHWNWSLSLIGWGSIFTLLLSACAAPAQPATPPLEAEPAPGNSPSEIRNLQQAAYHYNRYHELAPDDLMGPSARLRTSLKRLTEVCTALEHPSTELRAGAGVEDESCGEATERVIRTSQFAICTRRWRPAPTTGASWRNCWACRWRRQTATCLM